MRTPFAPAKRMRRDPHQADEVSSKDRHDPDANSARGYALTLRVIHEAKVRAGKVEPSTPREREWQREGKVPLAKLDAVQTIRQEG